MVFTGFLGPADLRTDGQILLQNASGTAFQRVRRHKNVVSFSPMIKCAVSFIAH